MGSKKLTWGIFAVYFLALSWIILFKFQLSFQNLPELRNINVIPFGSSTILNGEIDFSETICNLLAFVPFGIFIGVLGQRKPFVKMAMPVFLTSLFYETVQYIFAIGGSDITDLIANTLGGITGIGLFFILLKAFKEKTYKIINIVSLMAAVLLIALISLLFLANS